ncbi:hypothetical protein DYST_02919 [Dyella terrae]|nr:hypothetical protein DYST_02919 [Dyella terrae]
MKRTFELFALLLLTTGLAGCLNQAGFEKSVASRVHLGMMKDDAVSKLSELELSCLSPRTATGSDASRLDCSRQRPPILENCLQRVYIDVSAEGTVSNITIPEPACAWL